MNQLIAREALRRSGTASLVPPLRAVAPAAPLTIEIRPLSACAEIRQDWLDLAGRSLSQNLFFEPDFALAATQHLVAFRQAVAILVWQAGPGDAGRRLLGLVPCFPRNGLFVPDELVGFSNERILDGAPLLDADRAHAVVTAIMGWRQGWILEGRGLLLRRVDLDGPLIAPLLRAADDRGLSAMLRPARPTTAPAPSALPPRERLAGRPALSLREATTRADIRDAVEILLAIEASGPRGRDGTATLQDTREVGFLRAVTRGLARTRQCRLAMLMLDGEPIAAALILGRARRGFLYLAAEDERHAALMPLKTMLAMLRQSQPNRLILHAADASGSFGEVRLVPQAALQPRDLASRARQALRRGFSFGRAAGGG